MHLLLSVIFFRLSTTFLYIEFSLVISVFLNNSEESLSIMSEFLVFTIYAVFNYINISAHLVRLQREAISMLPEVITFEMSSTN
jgi:hypothetical protein